MAQHDLTTARPSRYVWFANFDQPVPVFHAPEPGTAAMACGAPERLFGCHVPLRLALKFARPCTRCWKRS